MIMASLKILSFLHHISQSNQITLWIVIGAWDALSVFSSRTHIIQQHFAEVSINVTLATNETVISGAL